jgi:preprotein translocase subunit SecB
MRMADAITPVMEDASSLNQRFVTQRIYIKGSSFEAVAMTPTMLKETRAPTVDFQAQATFAERGDSVYEATLAVTLTGKLEGIFCGGCNCSKAAYLRWKGLTRTKKKHLLNGVCMNLLFPYVCENVAGMVVKGDFSPVYLAPMNFEALYREQLRQQPLPEQSSLPETQPVTH